MQIEEQIFIGRTIEAALEDFACWRLQYDDCLDIYHRAYHVWILAVKAGNEIILYVEHTLYYENEKIYCVNLVPVATYDGVEEAVEKCISDIDSYIDNTVQESAR